MSTWHSYGKIYALGHPAIADLLNGIVSIEEKIDGSAFYFGVINGELKASSHHQELFFPPQQNMFNKACETAQALKDKLIPEVTYRCEYLARPKQNCLAYDRIPINNVIIYDVETSEHCFMDPVERRAEAERLGLEVVPQMFYGSGLQVDLERLKAMLEETSILGGQKIEGVVIKNYYRWGRDGHCLMGKYVSEKFKEVQKSDWKKENPGQGDIIQRLGEKYKSEARWNKAALHLAEQGLLQNDPKDIGPLLKEISQDVLSECKEEIMEELFKWAWKDISRLITRGVPEWYKERLLECQFTAQKPNMDSNTEPQE
jgi:hypothetical protein